MPTILNETPEEAHVIRSRIGSAFSAMVAAIAVVAMLSGCIPAGGSTEAASAGAGASAAASSTASATARHSAQVAAKVAAKAAARKQTAKAKNVCAHNRYAQHVIVSIRDQHAWMCAHHKVVYSTAITTGMAGSATRTPTGNYHIEGRTRNTDLVLNTGARYHVKYWIPFDAPLYGFHDSSWQHFPYGSAKYKTNGSHGCVHMPLKAMAFLYRWSARTTHVHIA